MPKPYPLPLPSNFKPLCRTVKPGATFRVLMGDDVLYLQFRRVDGKDRILFMAPEAVRIDRVDDAPVVTPAYDDDGHRADTGDRPGDRSLPPPPLRVAQGLGARLAARRGSAQGG